MTEDEKYADWCLGNNWIRLDAQAYEYVTGELVDESDISYTEWCKRSNLCMSIT